HQHGHHHALALADRAATTPQLLGQATRQQAAQRLALLLTVDDRLLQQAETTQRALASRTRLLRELEEQLFDRVVCSLGRGLPRDRDGLHRPALGDPLEQLLLALVELTDGPRRRDERLHDRGVEHAATGCDLA